MSTASAISCCKSSNVSSPSSACRYLHTWNLFIFAQAQSRTENFETYPTSSGSSNSARAAWSTDCLTFLIPAWIFLRWTPVLMPFYRADKSKSVITCKYKNYKAFLSQIISLGSKQLTIVKWPERLYFAATLSSAGDGAVVFSFFAVCFTTFWFCFFLFLVKTFFMVSPACANGWLLSSDASACVVK